MLKNKQWDAQRNLDKRCINAPMVGDYWHEMYCPIRVVVAVNKGKVTYCDKVKVVDKEGRWTWDLSSTKTVSLEKFKDLELKDRCEPGMPSNQVIPEHMKWVADYVERVKFGRQDYE